MYWYHGRSSVGAAVREPVHQRRGADVLHPAEEVGDRRLGILAPGIVHAGKLGKDLDHVRRHVEQRPGHGAVLPVDVIVHRYGPPGIVDLHQRSHDQRNQVGRRGLVLAPVMVRTPRAVRASLTRCPLETAVKPGHGGDHLPGHLVVGKVVGREPVVVVIVLALAPDLPGPVRRPGLGVEEGEPAAVSTLPA